MIIFLMIIFPKYKGISNDNLMIIFPKYKGISNDNQSNDNIS